MVRVVCLASLRPIFMIEVDRALHQFSDILECLEGCHKNYSKAGYIFLVLFVLLCGFRGAFAASESADSLLRVTMLSW